MEVSEERKEIEARSRIFSAHKWTEQERLQILRAFTYLTYKDIARLRAKNDKIPVQGTIADWRAKYVPPNFSEDGYNIFIEYFDSLSKKDQDKLLEKIDVGYYAVKRWRGGGTPTYVNFIKICHLLKHIPAPLINVPFPPTERRVKEALMPIKDEVYASFPPGQYTEVDLSIDYLEALDEEDKKYVLYTFLHTEESDLVDFLMGKRLSILEVNSFLERELGRRPFVIHHTNEFARYRGNIGFTFKELAEFLDLSIGIAPGS